MQGIGRYCSNEGIRELRPDELEQGMDFREPRCRRAVFLRFYEFHLRHKAHPGGVYYLIPWLKRYFGWSMEDTLWFCFLNGNTQHPITSLIFMNEFPTVALAHPMAVRKFLDKHWSQLSFDTDRRYWKTRLPEAVEANQRDSPHPPRRVAPLEMGLP